MTEERLLRQQIERLQGELDRARAREVDQAARLDQLEAGREEAAARIDALEEEKAQLAESLRVLQNALALKDKAMPSELPVPEPKPGVARLVVLLIFGGAGIAGLVIWSIIKYMFTHH